MLRFHLTAGLVLVLAGSAAAADLHVPSQFRTIQAAIDAAEAGDTVIVADGVYTGDGNRDVSFLGKAITVRSANGPAACIIDCEASQEDPHRGFHFGNAETPESVLDGFTIRNGSTPQGAIADEFNGAGILMNNHASPTIRNCVITDCWAGCWGGAVSLGWDIDASPTLINCTLKNNFSDDDGGAIFSVGANATIINTFIVDNGARIAGGGITNFGNGTITVINSTIVNNSAPNGSGMWDWQANVVNSIVRGNTGSATQIGGATTGVTYSNVEGGFDGVGNTDKDPRFVNAAAGDYHLAGDSPLIDAGDPASAHEGLADLDGDPRLIGLAVDIGADEHRNIADFNADGFVDAIDFLQVIANWGPCSDCPADTNGDNVVDALDFLAVIANWS
jgi:hypothetical protein